MSALIQCHVWVLFSSFVLSNRARMCVLDHFARKMNESNLLRFRSLFRCFYSFLLGVSSYFTINFDEQRRCNCPINISCKMNWTNEHTTHNTLTHTNTQYSISFNFIINHEVHWIRHFLYCWISFCLFFFFIYFIFSSMRRHSPTTSQPSTPSMDDTTTQQPPNKKKSCI